MKLSVCTIMLPELTPEEAVKAISISGYQGVEWRVTYPKEERQNEPPSFWGNNRCTLKPSEEDALRVKSLSESHHLAIAALDAYIQVGNLTTVEEILRFAHICGANRIRIGIWKPRGDSYQSLFTRAGTFLEEIEDTTRQHGIKWLIETHQQSICPSVSSAFRLVSQFDPQYVGVIIDPGNMVQEGYEDYRMGIELLGPYLAHVHIKSATFVREKDTDEWKLRWAPLDNGIVNFSRFIAALKEFDYNGWLSLEDFSQTRSSHEKLTHNMAFIKEILQHE